MSTDERVEVGVPSLMGTQKYNLGRSKPVTNLSVMYSFMGRVDEVN